MSLGCGSGFADENLQVARVRFMMIGRCAPGGAKGPWGFEVSGVDVLKCWSFQVDAVSSGMSEVDVLGGR
jgi:hypothetical protein